MESPIPPPPLEPSTTHTIPDLSPALFRFADWPAVQESQTFSSGVLVNREFYSGEAVSERMRAVGGSIFHIREKWKDYPEFMRELRQTISEEEFATVGEDQGLLEALFSYTPEWIDRGEGHSDSDDYCVLRFYLSDYGYRQTFRLFNLAMRMDNLTERQSVLRSAAFLIELLNIDLFNYTIRSGSANHFEGIVFRGTLSPEGQLREFKELAAKPISQRYWAVPMSIMSASTNAEKALAYATQTAAGRSDGTLLLWRIHVVELHRDLLQLYQTRFPSSVVSTICAVPLQELSPNPEDEEVLLRGPFFHLVRLQEELLVGRTERISVMDIVMLNTNRDHPSTVELGEEEGVIARRLFASLIEIGRSKACQRLATEFGLLAEAEAYDRLCNQMENTVKIILE